MAVVGAGVVAATGRLDRIGQRQGARRAAAHLRRGQGAGQVDVDWGPTCDTTTGRLAVPSGYAPPCVEPWTGGDNGGETAPGVTGDTITVALYQAQPDLLEQTFFEETGSDESLAKERDTTQEYVDYFSAHYELYGRKVELVTLKASGAPDDDVAAKADAIKVATELKRVRVVRRTGPDRRVRRGARGARRAVRGRLPDRAAPGVPRASTRRTCGRRSRHPSRRASTGPRSSARSWRKRQGRRTRATTLAAKKRVFGVVHYDDDAGTFRRASTHFERPARHVRRQAHGDRAVRASTSRPRRRTRGS